MHAMWPFQHLKIKTKFYFLSHVEPKANVEIYYTVLMGVGSGGREGMASPGFSNMVQI